MCANPTRVTPARTQSTTNASGSRQNDSTPPPPACSTLLAASSCMASTRLSRTARPSPAPSARPRTEAMLTDNQGRALVSVCELAFDEKNRITGYRVDTLSDLGAYNSQFAQMIPYVVTIVILAGFIGRAVPPASIGLPYEKESR
mgnify:CR=1 FL=1